VASNLSTLATGSHLLFMALGGGGPPAVLGLDAPDQGASQGPSGRWAILVGDQPNTPMNRIGGTIEKVGHVFLVFGGQC
jgi:hypothetical protein